MLLENSPRLLAYLQKEMPSALRNFVEPGDVLQDVFFKAFLSESTFREDGEDAAYRWLVTIARHRVADLVRMQRAAKRGGGLQGAEIRFVGQDVKDSREVTSILQDLAIYYRTPSQSAMSHEIVAAVQKSLIQIEPDYQTVITMRYIEGFSVKESAQRMGRTEAAILMLCRRALKSLEVHLKLAGAIAA